MWIDAHCHLEQGTYGDDLPDMLRRADAAGISGFVVVGATRITAGADEAVAFAAKHSNAWATVGIHPHDAAHATDAAMAHIETLLAQPKVVAVGEVGLDFHYAEPTPAIQRQVFSDFISMAKRASKPLMLHIREAHDDCFAMIDQLGLPEAGGVIHCFTGTAEQAKAYLERGFYLSIPGVVTFRNADYLRLAVADIPLDRLLLETDCPYLAPVPYRGKQNEPAYMVATAACVAAVKEVSLAELSQHTLANTARLFGLPPQVGASTSG